ncbi:MAG: hypothetical protein WC247_16435 [Porticoccaceae bacterium]
MLQTIIALLLVLWALVSIEVKTGYRDNGNPVIAVFYDGPRQWIIQ